MTNYSGDPWQEFDFNHNPTWRIFQIMSEFVEGFTFLAGIQKSVTFFGSARLPQDNPYSQLAYTLAHRLAERGYTVVTGGGPGIMEAANHGAFDAKGESVGLNIQLPREQRSNPYVKQEMSFRFFFSRKVMLDFSAEAYIVFPGGFGTLDELFELLTLIQTGKMEHNVPVILMGSAFWTPLLEWIEQEMLAKLQTIEPKDMQIWRLTDDIDEVVHLVESGIQAQTQQRLASKGRSRRTTADTLQKATSPMSKTEQ